MKYLQNTNDNFGLSYYQMKNRFYHRCITQLGDQFRTKLCWRLNYHLHDRLRTPLYDLKII